MSFVRADKLQGIGESFSLKVFLGGLGVVCLLYLVMYLYISFQSDKTLAELESHLASQAVMIEGVDHSQKTHDDFMAHTSELSSHDKMPAPGAEEEVVDIQKLLHGSAASGKALTPAPIDGFYEETIDGKLPVKKGKYQTPFQVYKKPFLLNREKPAVAIVILDYGLSTPVSKQALAMLPSTISLSLSSYSPEADMWQEHARADGHEVWLNLPVQRERFPLDDPGPKGLLTSVSLKYNQERLNWAMGRATGYAGLTAFTDSALNNSAPMFNDLINDVFKRGLGFLELNDQGSPFIKMLAEKTQAPYARNDASLKSFSSDTKALGMIENHIKNNKRTIITVQPTVQNLGALKKWINTLEQRGIQVVPVSAIAGLKE